jgi:non-ribosomal peptide synthase protein (TIGR01720 family)
LKQVKEQVRAIPQRGVGYGLLRYLSRDAEVVRKLGALRRAQLSFNYLGQLDQVFSGSSPFELAGESSGPRISPRASRRYLFDITGQVTGKQLQVFWRYSENIHRHDTVERLAQDFQAALRSIIAHCLASKIGGYTPSDFPEAHLSQQELDDLIAEFGQAVE